MPFGSIKETGVPVGGRVKCVAIDQDDLEHMRYTVGQVYTVVGRPENPGVHSNSFGRKVGMGDQVWSIPFAGFGAQWVAA